MQEDFFFLKKNWKYCDGILRYFTMFSQEKMQENKTYFIKYFSSNYCKIIVKKYYIFIGKI
jgi:hypothetical protein